MKKITDYRGVIVLLFVIAVYSMLSFSYVTAQAEGTDSQQVNAQQGERQPAPVGTIFTVEKDHLFDEKNIGKDTYKFKVTKSGLDGNGEVELISFSQKLTKNVWPGVRLEEDTACDDSGEEYTITSIGDRAFAKYCGAVTIGSEYIERIGDEAFAGCSSVYIGIEEPGVVKKNVNSLKTIGRKAFSRVENIYIYAVEIGRIGSRAFSGADYVHIKAKKIGSIGSNAFSGADYVSVITEEEIGQVGSNAFSGARAVWLKGAEIKQIDSHAFTGVKESVTLDIGKIGRFASGALLNVKEVTLSMGAADNRLYKSCNGKLEIYGSDKWEINDQTFSGCENVKSINIYLRDSSVQISAKALRHFRKARSIYISGDGIKEIQSQMFTPCKQVRTIELEFPNVTKIGDRAFSGCKNLKKISISRVIKDKTGIKIKTIGRKIFSGCKKLRKFNMNGIKNIKSVKKDAFKGANSKCRIYVYSKKSIALRLKGKGMEVLQKPYLGFHEPGIANGYDFAPWKKI